MTDVAVVMPCYNYGHYVREALASIAAQSLRPTEVIVIDDGSTDNSLTVLEGARNELSDSLPIRIVSQTNRGVALVLNRGVQETRSPYVMFVSADDVARPHLLAKLHDALEATPSAGYAYPKMCLFGDESGVYLSYPFSAGRLIFDHNYVPGAAMVRREAFIVTGGFRELVAHEDWDLWLTFLAHGWPGVFVPEVLYEWRRHQTARNHQSRSTRRSLRLAIWSAHRSILARHAHLAPRYVSSAIWRRIRVRYGPPPKYARSSSCWVEAPQPER
ncbi:MAG TPA: glycosyltransferase family A protein [Mycobacteriales bacterium]|jgi:glycosyltransferase involved in cell wall biosynthesis|nr:glycosyltransferase family A protein [Mycobacteriales bacterium]